MVLIKGVIGAGLPTYPYKGAGRICYIEYVYQYHIDRSTITHRSHIGPQSKTALAIARGPAVLKMTSISELRSGVEV